MGNPIVEQTRVLLTSSGSQNVLIAESVGIVIGNGT